MSILIGYLEKSEPNKTAKSEECTTYFGHGPSTLTPNGIIDELRTCVECKQKLCFVLQMSCPLENVDFERHLYVFACENPNCQGKRNSWTVFRDQSISSKVFYYDAIPKSTKNHTVLPFRPLSSQVEEFVNPIDEKHIKETLCMVDTMFFFVNRDSSEYEQTDPNHGDVVFHKFLSRVNYNPDQVLRYEWNGKPLRYTAKSPEEYVATKCTYCGSDRVFEFQLISTLVNYLKRGKRTVIEFGTINVFTCRKSCWSANDVLPKKEFVNVECDPDFDAVKAVFK
ncbi:hypothetical protein ACOME3_001551 [Neoechinorhynchus agilis]